MNQQDSSPGNRRDLDEALREIVVRVLMVDPGSVVPDAELVGDLGAESIDFLDLLFQLEDFVGRRVPPEEWEKWITERLPDPRYGAGITVALFQEFARGLPGQSDS